MKNKLTTICTLAIVYMLAMTGATYAYDSQGLSLGARYHTEEANMGEVPFDDNDWSYCLAYEYRTQAAFWQIGAMWAPEASLDPDIENVITPFLNLMFYDRYLEAGFGILDPYILRDEGDDDWGEFSYQFILGLYIPLGSVNLKIDAYLPVYDWDIFSDFDFKNIEYGAWLNFTF
jgi:hypothetical protein